MTPPFYRHLELKVDNGVALLDRHEPGWHHHIDLSDLDICSANRCIMGQLYGSYERGVRYMSEREGMDTYVRRLDAVKYGFAADGQRCYEVLTAIWRRRVDERLAVTAAERELVGAIWRVDEINLDIQTAVERDRDLALSA